MADYSENRWVKPNKRAASYAAERKAKVHQHGPKEGKELTDYEAGIVRDTYSARATIAGFTSTKRHWTKAKPRKKRRQFPENARSVKNVKRRKRQKPRQRQRRKLRKQKPKRNVQRRKMTPLSN